MPKENYYNDGGGIYCFMLYDNIEKDGKSIFKVGLTTQTFQRRLQAYHTPFVHGVIPICLLYCSEIRDKKGNVKDIDDDMPPLQDIKILLEIEKYIMNLIEKNGGIPIFEKRRKRNQGQTEVFYTDLQTIRDSFQNADEYFSKKYKKTLKFQWDSNPSTEKLQKQLERLYKKKLKTKDHFVGEYFYSLKKPDSIFRGFSSESIFEKNGRNIIF